MLVRANYKLWQVQKQFHDLFPFLRLEFTRHEQLGDKPLHLNKTLSETCHVDPETLLVTDEYDNLNWLKRKFQEVFHLNIRIYKKIGGYRWKEIQENDNTYLSEINRICESSNMQIRNVP